MKKSLKKLSLARETLRLLENRRLGHVMGGTDEEGDTGGEFGSRTVCPTCPRSCYEGTCRSDCAGCTA